MNKGVGVRSRRFLYRVAGDLDDYQRGSVGLRNSLNIEER